MMDIVDRLKTTLNYMDKSKDFNESASVINVIDAIQTIEKLQAKVAELQRDADRYRFIRNTIGDDGCLTIASVKSIKLGSDTFTHDRLDEAIDKLIEGK